MTVVSSTTSDYAINCNVSNKGEGYLVNINIAQEPGDLLPLVDNTIQAQTLNSVLEQSIKFVMEAQFHKETEMFNLINKLKATITQQANTITNLNTQINKEDTTSRIEELAIKIEDQSSELSKEIEFIKTQLIEADNNANYLYKAIKYLSK